jgi:transposase-like protein
MSARIIGGWRPVLVVWAFLWCSSCPGQESAFECFAVTDLVRVFEDGYHCPPPQDRIEVFGIRDEYVSAQCVVKALKDVQDLTVSLGPLKHTGSDTVLPADHLAWNFVGSIAIAENAPNHSPSELIRPAPARFPDYLSDAARIGVPAGQCQAVYLTMRIPADAPAGEYQGTVRFRGDGEDRTLPLVLTVFPLTLPQERHLMVTEWFSTGRFQQFHGIDPADPEAFYRMLGVYARNMAEHRQNVFHVPLELVATTKGSDGQLAFDFSRFDRWADVFWSTGRMDLLETGFVARFGTGDWSSKEIVLRDFRVRDPATNAAVTIPGREFLPQFLPALEQHLQQRGWLDKTVFHIADEPSNHNIMSWRAASDFVYRHGPRLRRMDAIETPHCLDRLEVWVPKIDHFATWQDAFTDAQRRGAEMWIYTVGIFQAGPLPNKTVDVPLIQSRVLHWFNYRFGLTGYLHWGLNQWTQDPFDAPGQHRGDGWHVYPKKEGLLDSLRWEQMRNGIQDYECLRLLEDRLRRMQQGWSPRVSARLDPTRRSVELAAAVVPTAAEFSNDPNVLYRARRQLLQEILDLDRTPRLVVQTEPPEQARVARGAALDVHGWAEPGTRIMVNGVEVPVADDGLFLENVTLTPQRTLVIEARHPTAGKRLVRRFRPWREDLDR